MRTIWTWILTWRHRAGGPQESAPCRTGEYRSRLDRHAESVEGRLTASEVRRRHRPLRHLQARGRIGLPTLSGDLEEPVEKRDMYTRVLGSPSSPPPSPSGTLQPLPRTSADCSASSTRQRRWSDATSHPWHGLFDCINAHTCTSRFMSLVYIFISLHL